MTMVSLSSPKSELRFFNNAAGTWPKPRPVIESVCRVLEEAPLDHRRISGDSGAMDIIEHTRTKLSRFFGLPCSSRLLFCPGATAGLNYALQGLGLKSGDSVVTTSSEHNSVLRPLNHLARDKAVEVRIARAGCMGVINPAEVISLMDSTTRLVCLNHASNVTGRLLSIEAIIDKARHRNIPVLLDTSQSAGLVDIDMEGEGIDILVAAGHKYMYGVPGIGIIALGEGIALSPLITGGTGIRSDLLYQPESLPELLEPGTPNIPGIASLAGGLEFIEEAGMENLRNRMNRLRSLLIEGLGRIKRISLFIGGKNEEREISRAGESMTHTPVVSFRLDGFPVSDTGQILEESFGLRVRTGLHCAPLIHQDLGTWPEGTVRVSFSPFTTADDIAYLLEAVAAIAGAAG